MVGIVMRGVLRSADRSADALLNMSTSSVQARNGPGATELAPGPWMFLIDRRDRAAAGWVCQPPVTAGEAMYWPGLPRSPLAET